MTVLTTPKTQTPSLLHHLFDRVVARWPDRVAVDVPPSLARARRRTVTYAELNARANLLAHRLQPVAHPEAIVAIFVERGNAQLYSAQIAVLKAGAAFTCLDAAFPDEQIRAILQDADAVAVLADEAGRARLERVGIANARVIDVRDEAGSVFAPAFALGASAGRPAGPEPVEAVERDALAYIIYTSGTTGRPKGVMIEHGSVANLVAADVDEFRLTPDDRVGQGSSPAYDSSVEEMWLAFAAGATLVVMDDETSRLGPDLIPWLRDERITVLCPPPTLLRATGCRDPQSALPALRLLYVGGEALTSDVADRWAPGRRLVNGYGPTEVTVTSVRGDVHAGEPISIGTPTRGLRGWVLNDALEEITDDAPGELCLGGAGLARGYRHLPDATAAKFPAHPTLGRIYRTGDLVQRAADGRFFYLGRLDSQVKLRGYRIELEAVETRLAECAGVRDAACAVQGTGAQQVLAAFIVPADPSAPPSFDALKIALGHVMPPYMVPGRFALIDALPATIGGKIDRRALPETLEIPRTGMDVAAAAAAAVSVHQYTDIEARVASAFAEALAASHHIALELDFFTDLGGDSLRGALAISRLRDHESTRALTVRDLYEARTAGRLAARAAEHDAVGDDHAGVVLPHADTAKPHPAVAGLVQTIFLLGGLVAASAIAYLACFVALPVLVDRLGLVLVLLCLPLLVGVAMAIYTPVALGVAVALKKILIGRYRPMRVPVWSSFHMRHWIVLEAVKFIPWRYLNGTSLQIVALRALGARIGQRVHIHRGVDVLHGGWDLLEIGDDVSISQDALVRLVDLDDGHLVIGPVTLERGSTLDVRAGVGPGGHLEEDATLTALSSLPPGGRIPRGERWDGIPARRVGLTPPVPAVTAGSGRLSPAMYALALALVRFGWWSVLTLPGAIGAWLVIEAFGAGAPSAWLRHPTLSRDAVMAVIATVLLTGPLTLALAAVTLRAIGRVRPGVIDRWSLAYIRVGLKATVVDVAGECLTGTLFWPTWLRWAGMRIGRACEVSTIIDVVPELIDIGDDCFLADGIYLGGPRIDRGTVTLAPVRLGSRMFIGNHVVIGGGQQMADDVLLGICAVADDKTMPAGTAWFGHPPFALPRREIIEADRRVTHNPSFIRYWNRVGWELSRFAMPIVPMLVLFEWFVVVADARAGLSPPALFTLALPLATLGSAALLCAVVLALKWILLGRVRPGQHPLWSCWCSRWDFLYVIWGLYARRPLAAIEGTFFLTWYLRASGVSIGKRVVLGAGFSQVVDPDMLVFEDDATVDGQFQAHTFEDRMLKIDQVIIRRHATVGSTAVLLYGADIGEGTHVTPHSVVMKKERLLAGRTYDGAPTRMEA